MGSTMSPASAPVTARLAAGAACLWWVRRRRRTWGRERRWTRDPEAVLGAVLGVRYVVQGLGLWAGLGDSRRLRLAVESVHAASMGAVALALPRPRPALNALCLAACIMTADAARPDLDDGHDDGSDTEKGQG